MLNIKENNIYLTRGDDAEFELKLTTPEGEPYELQDGESAHFTMRKEPIHAGSKPPLVHKEFVEGIASIDSIDTKYLKYGVYLYDVQVENVQGKVNTVAFGKFVLTPEVG